MSEGGREGEGKGGQEGRRGRRRLPYVTIYLPVITMVLICRHEINCRSNQGHSIIRTHGSGSYVGLASWAWFSSERFKTVTKHCLYSPARI